VIEMLADKEIRRIQSEIRRVLVDVWDPIGIKGVTNAQDEYDAYIGGLFHLLNRGGSEEEISAYLWKVIEEKIHIHPQKGATQEAAKALRRIRME
jgi:hypothetical protein